MEEGLPFTAFKHVRRFSTTVEIGKPFAVFRIREMAPGPVIKFIEPVEIFFVPGDFVSVQIDGCVDGDLTGYVLEDE